MDADRNCILLPAKAKSVLTSLIEVIICARHHYRIEMLKNYLSRLFLYRISRPASKISLTLIAFLFTCSLVFGQKKNYQLLPFDKRASFGKMPANWAFADSVYIHPEKTNPSKITPGSRVLVGKTGEALEISAAGAKNFKFLLSYTLTRHARMTVVLPGGAAVQLSEGREEEGSQTNGFTGQLPVQNIGKIAGLRQTLEIDYESEIPRFPGRARINEVKINGVVVQQGQYIAKSGSPSLTIQVAEGTVVLHSAGFQIFENIRPVTLTNLAYKIYNDAWDSRKTDMLGQSGTSPVLTFEVAEEKKSYNLVYEADLVVERDGDYNFTTIYTGAYCQLSIDGNVVLDTDHSNSQETHHTNVRLEKGSYRLKLWYSRLPWSSPALGLRVGERRVRDYDLHALSSLPQPRPKPFIVARPTGERAEMVRSFIQLPTENHKRTHCLSVGAPNGRNFSIDLNRAALLQVWSGEFANTTEMWYERGERQTLTPMGLTEPVSYRSSFCRLPTPESPWVDSAAVNFLDYRVDARGLPSIRYALGPSVIEDALTTIDNGIQRTITPERNASNNNYVLLAEGREIRSVEKGLYLVDGRFYIKIPAVKAPVLRKSNGKNELLLPLAAPVSFSILW
ncbi:hypothetical protein [Ravibacter arvi]